MGTIRLILALGVLVYHRGGHRSFFPGFVDLWPVPGPTAVEAFFVVSGFFMAMVLSTKYAGLPRPVFWKSRALRIYVDYWLVLALAVVLAAVVRHAPHKVSWGFAYMFSDGTEWSLGALLLWAGTAIGIVGQEVWFFNGGTLTDLGTPGREEALRYLHTYQPISPAWSLSLELQFYLLAPFLVRMSTRLMAIVFGASLVLRMAVESTDLPFEPYVYSLLPEQLCLFLTGMLSYRLFGHWSRTMPRWSAWLSVAALSAMLIFYPWRSIHAPVDWMKLTVLVTLFFTLPMLAKVDTKLDRFLGDLSYPVYLVHLPVMYAVAAWWPAYSLPQVAFLLALVFGISALIVLLVDGPIAAMRQRLSARAAALEDAWARRSLPA